MFARRKDTEYAADLKAPAMRGPRLSTNLLLYAIALFFAAAVGWAAWATLDEVTSGQGRVIPSSQVQVVQNHEGGIISGILVREGEVVEEGQLLLRIDDTGAASAYRENRARYLALVAKIARLYAEARGRKPKYPPELDGHDDLIARESALYRAHLAELDSAVAVFARQAEQRRQEFVELESRVNQLEDSIGLAREELAILTPMVEKGVTAKIELLRLQRQISGLVGEAEASRLAMPRSRSALAEVARRIEEKRATFRSAAQAELGESELRLKVLAEAITAVEDRVTRTDVRSPVYGTVKQLKINTIGGVIKPGMDLIEIVPLEDNLLVEAHIRPADIAFLRPGQDAKVKITAYDFASYGALPAKLEHISADTIVDEQGESFYQIRVRTAENHLGSAEKPLPIIPSMVAQVDILTGKKSVLDYLLKPVLRARENALRER